MYQIKNSEFHGSNLNSEHNTLKEAIRELCKLRVSSSCVGAHATCKCGGPNIFREGIHVSLSLIGGTEASYAWWKGEVLMRDGQPTELAKL